MPNSAIDLVARYGPTWKTRPYRYKWPRNIRIERILQELRWANDAVASRIEIPPPSNGALGRGITNLAPLGSGMPRTWDLSVPERFLVYLQYVWALGGPGVRQEFLRGSKIVVAFREPTSSLVNLGKGTYDDRFVILWRNYDNGWVVRELAANTEPSAQYDQAAANQKKYTAMAGVTYRKPEGNDLNDDGLRDMGRIQPGVYDFNLDINASRPVPLDKVFRIVVPARNYKTHVMRDIGHNGYFDDGKSGIDSLNTSFLIHTGGGNNTWSAGCQTLPPTAPSNTIGYYSDPKPWKTFWDTMRPQKSLAYILVDVKSPFMTVDNSKP